MKMSTCQVAVIGAGPFGLAAAAHLRSANIETWVFGQTMEFWRKQMPEGMLLRSPYEATSISDPGCALNLDSYQKAMGVRLSRPVPLKDFVTYGRWFQGEVVPDLDIRRVMRVERGPIGFRLILADGESVEAQRVVIAAGIGSFAHRPPEFNGIPDSLVTHAADHCELRSLAGKRVMVLGGGQSAMESAALLHEAGANVELIMRRSAVRWLRRSAMLHSYLNPFKRLLYSWTDIGPAGLSHLVARPGLLKRVPMEWQRKLAERSIRPAAAAWLVSRVSGMPITTGRHVTSAEAKGSELVVKLDDGSTRRVDHAILATGYRVDVSRYDFLSRELMASLAVFDGYPELGNGFESSVAGLHFLGAAAAWSFGPLMRFVAGTRYGCHALTQWIADKAGYQYGDQRPWLAVARS